MILRRNKYQVLRKMPVTSYKLVYIYLLLEQSIFMVQSKTYN